MVSDNSPLNGNFLLAAIVVVLGGFAWTALGEDFKWYVVVVVLAAIAAQHQGLMTFFSDIQARISVGK